MIRSAAFLFFLPLVFLVGACSRTPAVVFSPEVIYPQLSDEVERPRPAPALPRVAVVPFDDERADLRSQFPPAGVPIVEFLTLFYPTVTSHPEQSITPVPEKPLGVVGAMAFANALREVEPNMVIDLVTIGGNDTMPATYDIVISGRLMSTTAKHVKPSYGLNFFSIVDLSVLPKLLGAPTERMAGQLMVVVEARERWSGRLIQRGELHWVSPTYSRGYYSSGGAMGTPSVRYYQDWAEKAFPELGRKLLDSLKENPS